MTANDLSPEWQQSVYDQLHELAQAALAREFRGNSLQPTMLVHDAYLKLVDQKNVDPADRSLILAAGATIIRRLLIDYARARKAQKRGAGKKLENHLHISVADSASQLNVLELNDALEELARENPRPAQVVEMRFFGGLTGDEIAEHLGVSLSTINNDWRFAKAWLYRELDTEP